MLDGERLGKSSSLEKLKTFQIKSIAFGLLFTLLLNKIFTFALAFIPSHPKIYIPPPFPPERTVKSKAESTLLKF